MGTGAIQRDGTEIDAMLADLRRDGRLRVRNEQRSFWILRKLWCGELDQCAPSWDGKNPAEPFRFMSGDQIWNWLARLERA